MGNSQYYNTKSINFIKILNRILVSFLIIVVILVFALSMNDTVKFSNGEIFSNSPQIKLMAPNEVKVLKNLVREGQEVKKGDTLFILENKKTKSDHNILLADIDAMENKIIIIKSLISNTVERKNSLQQLLNIQSNIYQTDRKKAAQEISFINNKINLSSQQTSILTDKYKTDSILYVKGAISKYEMTETKSRNLDTKKGQIDINSSYKIKNYDYENLSNNYQKTNNDLKRSIIDVDNQIHNFKRDTLELSTMIKDAKYNLNYVSDELNKMVIVSKIEGTISNLYNVRQNLEIVPKGELLAIIAPKKETFYAKVILEEKDMAYIKKGQEINLKLDAYNYYRFGAVKGKITYVSPSDVNQSFYCLANLNKYNSNINLKAGYKLKGEVIIEKMRLFQYLIKKLFNKIDNSVN